MWAERQLEQVELVELVEAVGQEPPLVRRALQLLPQGPRPREVRLVAAKDSPTARAGVKIYVRTVALAKK